MGARKCDFAKYLFMMLTLIWSAALVSGPVWGSTVPEGRTAGLSSVSKAQAAESYGRLPLFFTENRGQVDSQVKFFTKGQGHGIYFTPQGMVLGLSRDVNRGGKKDGKGRGKGDRALVQLRPQGIRAGVEILATEPLAGKVNFFQGNDPAKWQTGVPTYNSVLYREAYPGIDLKFYGVGQQVEYDLVVKPGADPKQIKFLYQGVKALKVTKSGDLNVILPDGGQLVQKSPVIYQEINGQRISREGKFRILPGKNRGYGFELASYDTRYPLIIDPVVLVYSTYLGGNTWESGNAIAVDATGAAYVVGTTQSPAGFPLVSAAQGTFGGPPEDAFVTKFNPAGNALVYSTYLGGSDDDIGQGVAVDATGNAYVTGETFSTDFPRVNPFQNSKGGVNTAFFSKFDLNGALVYSTYLGGSTDASLVAGTGSDVGKVIAVDTAGMAYVAGETSSTDFPLSVAPLTPFQGQLNGTINCFVTKINPTQGGPTGLIYSTYMGGTTSDSPWGIAVDAAGAAYVAGETQSGDFPVTNLTTIQGFSDAFVTKLALDGATQTFSTYWGGTGNDLATGGIAVDSAGNIYIAGNTDSTDFPKVTPFQATLNGFTNAFVTKFDGTTFAPVYSTYLGGDGVDIAWFLAVDNAGSVYVTGETDSTNFPTAGSLQNKLVGARNAFVTKFTPLGTGLAYSIYLGGTSEDYGFGIAVDSGQHIYLTGFTTSADWPVKNAIKSTPAPLGSAFVAKLTQTSIVGPIIMNLLLSD